jgi:membrane associated rhomboid family serine protease
VPARPARPWRPLVTYALIATAALVFAVPQHGLAHASAPTWSWAALSIDPLAAGEVWRLATGPLAHLSLPHLVGNLLSLLIFGRALERRIGRSSFAAVCGAAALASDAGALLVSPHVPTLGISGVVYAIAGALFMVERRRGAAHLWVGRFIAYNVAVTLAYHAHLSLGAHVGGLLAGLAIGALLEQHPTPRPAPSTP